MGTFVSSDNTQFGTVGQDLPEIKTDDLVGGKFTINGCKFLQSKYQEGEYVLADVTVSGKHFAWSTSGSGVKRDLKKNGADGNFPCDVVLELVPTDKGNPYIRLTSAD